jgi:hypothetical protein
MQNQQQVIAFYQLPLAISLTPDCLELIEPIEVDGIPATLTLPSTSLGPCRFSQLVEPQIVAPTFLQKRLSDYLEEVSINRGFWGRVSSLQTKAEPMIINAWELSALTFQFQVSPGDISPGDELRNQWLYKGSILTWRGGIERWWRLVSDWLEVLSSQNLDPESSSLNPMLSTTIGAGLWMFSVLDQTGYQRLRNLQEHYIALQLPNPIPSQQLRFALKSASNCNRPSDARLLYRDARSANFRSQNRRAAIDAGSAAETALADYARLDGIAITSKTTLGSYLQIVANARPELQLDKEKLKAELVEIRNSAIHDNRIPNNEQISRMFSHVELLLDRLEPISGL